MTLVPGTSVNWSRRTADFDYELPDAAIAQTPIEPRDAARLLVDREGVIGHRTVLDLPDLLEPGDLLVVNDSRVVPARLHLHKPTGGRVEVLLLEPLDGSVAEARTWSALVRPARRVPPGTELCLDESPVAVVTDRDGETATVVFTEAARPFLAEHGAVPLPPYIHTELADAERYQTVFAAREGSVAAPTAGLHLTPRVLDACRSRGVEVATVDLAVGLGTFRPVTAEVVDDHDMHAERYVVPSDTVAAIERAVRVVAVGTTVVRTLETWAASGETKGSTDLFIRRGFDFRVVDRLLTNFHVPRSTLLVLLDAFIGDRWRDLYATALAEGYRFLSFGDAMLVDRDVLAVELHAPAGNSTARTNGGGGTA